MIDLNRLTIRPMKSDEAEMLYQVGKKKFSLIERVAISKPEYALVAMVDGNFAGAGFYEIIAGADNKRMGYVSLVYIIEQYRGEGIGNILYPAVIDLLKSECDLVTAMVYDDNVASWKLFQKQGFSRAGILDTIKAVGLSNSIKLWLKTFYCIASGNNLWVSKPIPPYKSIQEGFTYFLLNIALLLPFILFALLFRGNTSLWALPAMLTVVTTTLMAGRIGCLIARRSWNFQLVRGGILVTLIVSFFGLLFPVYGRWYPSKYENSSGFRRDMGIEALCEWLGIVALCIPAVLYPTYPYFIWISNYAASILLYHVFTIYPFAHFGSRRILHWSKVAYLLMIVASLICLYLLWQPFGIH